MKVVALSLLSLTALLFLAGCASEENGYYTPSQVAAQHAGYDPTARVDTPLRY